MAIVTFGIGTAARDYSTITLWKEDLDNDTPYDAGDDAVGELFNDSVFDETVDIDTGGTLGLTSRKLTVPVAERHDGTAGTGARLVRTSSDNTIVDIGIAPTTIEWFEMDGNDLTSLMIARGDASPDTTNKVIYQFCLIHGIIRTQSNQNINGLIIPAGRGDALNNIIYRIEQQSTGAHFAIGLNFGVSVAASDCLHNTVHDVVNDNGSGNATGLSFNDDVDNTVQNNIATGAAGTSSGTIQDYSPSAPSNATVDHNASEDTTSSGTGSIDSLVVADTFVSTVRGSEDLHLKSGAAVLGAGTDKTADVPVDIDNEARPTTPDIGADEVLDIMEAIERHYPRGVERGVTRGVA